MMWPSSYRHAPPPRHPPGGRRVGRCRHPPLPSRAAHGSARERRPRRRLRRHPVRLPRVPVVPRGARRGAGPVLSRAPLRQGGPRRGRDDRHRRGARRAALRRHARRPLRRLVAGDPRGHRVRPARLGGDAQPRGTRPRAPGPPGPGGPAAVRGGLRGHARRCVGPLPAPGHRGPRLPRPALRGRAPPGGREVRRASHPAITGTARDMAPGKLVLTVIDGMKPAMLERAIETGRAPVLQRVVERGTYVDGCTAAFPSVTPVCAATIATGRRQDEHHIPAMNWFSRTERRYVEYGSSFSAARRFGIAKQLADTVYNMNMEHLPADVPTVFESLDDADVRTAGTTYLMYRGRHRHEVSRETALTRLASTVMRRHVMGPRELFYADVFASRETGCRSQLGMPGVRDRHTGCVGAHLVEHDLFDFLLFSLPDNDTHSHKNGPHAQVASIAEADRQLERMTHAGGGIEAFLDEHAMIVVADHSHAAVERTIGFFDGFSDYAVAGPGGTKTADAELALCPSQRSAMIYVLVGAARETLVPRLVRQALDLEGVDLAMHRAGDEAVITGAAGELRFAPGGPVRDERGEAWHIAGDLGVLAARQEGGVLRTSEYPDALARVWAAVRCETSGDVLLSAAPGFEFPDWGGVDHVGGGSHGSLHRSGSLGALAFSGVAPPDEDRLRRWSIGDVAPMIRAHFGAA